MEAHKSRIIGFDLARAYAVFGMFIVNYNVVFGDYYDKSWLSKFLSLFSGNSSTVFVMLAGMGVALMSNRKFYTPEEKNILRNKMLKRALFLLVSGLILSLWWPADILHFYAVYMFVAAYLLFYSRNLYLYVALLSVIIFHILLFILPYETAWNFETLEYKDFWTIEGFFRSTFYNGWNSVFPWLGYFTIGMYLGRLDWTLAITQKKMFIYGLILYLSIFILQSVSKFIPFSDDINFFMNADYLPPFLPFLISTTGFGLVIIAFFMYISKFLSENDFAKGLAKTGQMTLTHYISHLTIGLILFSLITNESSDTNSTHKSTTHPLIIFGFACGYFIISYQFSKMWSKKFKNGPFEMLMRAISS